MTDTIQPTTDKITLAVVVSRLDALAKSQEQGFSDMRHLLEGIEGRVRQVEHCQGQMQVEIKNTKDDMDECQDKVEAIKTRDTIGTVVTSVIALISGLLGISIK